MTTICTRCDGTGFLNAEQLPDGLRELGTEAVRNWIHSNESDVQVCDCCGDGDGWYGEPGEHYGPGDPPGREGPYSYNGGLCECH